MVQAAGMYKTLLAGDDPAVVIEVLNGYRVKETMPENVGDYTVPLGKVDVLREGSDVTVVTYGACCRVAEDAAKQLDELGISVELIDAQTLSPFDKKIYMSNHGARGGDWFGEAKKGENYGWKILGWGGTNYSGIPIGPKWKPGFTKAIHYWVPSIATSAITIYKGKEFSEWNGHALITSLKDQSLRKLIFNDLSNIKEDIIFKNKIGRIRDIQIHPINGKIYFLGGDSLWLMQKN